MSCDPAVETELAASWEMMIRFYDRFIAEHDAWAWLSSMRTLVVRLRDAGYHRTLRAGQSMTTFIVSRSRAHGMRPEQPSITFTPHREHVVVATHRCPTNQTLTLRYEGDLDPALLEILDALEVIPLD